MSDNLNTHTKGAFYEAFPPELARAYVKRIEFCHTPKHGSWLNIAECELSCLTSQCLNGRRIGELPLLQSEVGIWSDKTNIKQRGVDWQFKIDDATTKLKRLYPKIKCGCPQINWNDKFKKSCDARSVSMTSTSGRRLRPLIP